MWSYPTVSIQDVSSKAYTYIVVGGGTAGCVVAARLSEDPRTSVLLVERGPIVDGWSARVPLLSSNFTDQKAPVYKWQSAPLTAVNGKTLTMVTGKALGGSSKINGLLYTRSVPGEYNAWEQAGRKNWSWRDVEPYFKRSEAYLDQASSDRGMTGPWQIRNVEKVRFQPVASNIQCAPRQGIPFIPKANDPISPVVACTHLDATIDSNGHRSATSDAFLPRKVVQARKNLHICTDTVVSALDIQHLNAVGVFLEHEGTAASQSRFHVTAEREVILCAGAISSPQILLLSGIGPADHLLQHNIPVVKDLSGVGAYLQDHISVPVIYKVPVAGSIEVLMKQPLAAVGELLKYAFTGKGMFGTQVQQANLVLRSALLDENSHVVITEDGKDLDPQDPSNIPDIEIMLIPVNPTDRKFDNLSKSEGTFSYLCTVLRPKSTGSVRLASSDPREQPLCDLGTLSVPDDRTPLRKALRLSLALARGVRASGYPFEDLLAPASESDEDLDTFANENLTTTYHYSSSCRMDDEAHFGVVDETLRVHGISGLRVADASVFPQIPACHLQAPVAMVAERCAEFLKREYGHLET
ncbi:putative (gmc) oxidoreductase [Lyophyllum shimeji]|uniref:(Gmc) oxidoreductase n=1 Tax=Lyophyllum shimeji TaxID=47721 RepID=A0A9P3PPQ5_LYOSH|nr:putative (gmc) oxidoreductase [Lyophyllum shimeji]